MKRVLNYLLLSLSLIVCFGSCKQKNPSLEQDKIDISKLKTKLDNSIFRYEIKDKKQGGLPDCIQIQIYCKLKQEESSDVNKKQEHIVIFRSGNEQRLEGFDEYVKELDRIGRFGTVLGEIWFVTFDEASPQIKITEHYKSDEEDERFAILDNQAIWGNDVLWIRYNPTKDVLEVKLKTPLSGDRSEPIIYELRRVKNDITDRLF